MAAPIKADYSLGGGHDVYVSETAFDAPFARTVPVYADSRAIGWMVDQFVADMDIRPDLFPAPGSVDATIMNLNWGQVQQGMDDNGNTGISGVTDMASFLTQVGAQMASAGSAVGGMDAFIRVLMDYGFGYDDQATGDLVPGGGWVPTPPAGAPNPVVAVPALPATQKLGDVFTNIHDGKSWSWDGSRWQRLTVHPTAVGGAPWSANRANGAPTFPFGATVDDAAGNPQLISHWVDESVSDNLHYDQDTHTLYAQLINPEEQNVQWVAVATHSHLYRNNRLSGSPTEATTDPTGVRFADQTAIADLGITNIYGTLWICVNGPDTAGETYTTFDQATWKQLNPRVLFGTAGAGAPTGTPKGPGDLYLDATAQGNAGERSLYEPDAAGTGWQQKMVDGRLPPGRGVGDRLLAGDQFIDIANSDIYRETA